MSAPRVDSVLDPKCRRYLAGLHRLGGYASFRAARREAKIRTIAASDDVAIFLTRHGYLDCRVGGPHLTPLGRKWGAYINRRLTNDGSRGKVGA